MFVRANLFDQIVGHNNVRSSHVYLGRERWLKENKNKKIKITLGRVSRSPWRNVPDNIYTVT